MANPDISNITELNAGTLAFTLKTDQVTFLMATQEDAKVDSAQTYDIAFELNDASDGKLSKHATFKDEFMLAFMTINDGFAGTPTVAFQGDGGTESFTAMPDTLFNDGLGGNLDGKMFYRKTPTLSDGDLEVDFGASENGACSVYAFSHVDQTTPFKTQPWFDHAGKSGESDHAVWKGMSNGSRISWQVDTTAHTGPMMNRMATVNSSSDARNNLRYDESNLYTSNPSYYYGTFECEMNPGDLMVGCWIPDDSSRHPDPQNTIFIGGTKSYAAQMRSQWMFLSPYEGPGRKVPLFINRSHGPGRQGSSSNQSMWYTVLQSNQTKTTLFAGVADYVIKLNQIYISNPEVSGTMVDIDVTGLTGSGTNFTASDGSTTVVTVTGDSGTQPTDFTVCKGKMAQKHKPIPVLDRPIYLPATAGLKAKATHQLPWIEYLDRTVDVVVDFEVIGDA